MNISGNHHRALADAAATHDPSDAWTRSPLMIFAVAMAILAAAFAVGIAVDPRTIGGQPAWLKPFKFGVSISVYTATIAWMLRFLQSDNRWVRGFVRVFVWTSIAGFAVEMVAIVTQVVRGTTSHFNVSTGFDAAVWGVMAVAVLVLWSANLVLAGVLALQRFEDPVVAWSVRLGVAIAVIGMAQAFLMTNPTAQQMAALGSGETVSIIGAHSVGAADGGAGIPVTGWRTDAGDLRLGHFVGIHGLQAIPLIGWFLGRRRRLGQRQKVTLVGTAAAGYLGLVALVTWQALRAQPLLQPDTLTVGAFAGLAIAVGSAGAWIVWSGRRSTQPVKGRATSDSARFRQEAP